MWEERTYTMEEIERETGLDRRTIAYYVQEGLLPRVGRRGPKTRYPRPFLDRLLFIQKIRGLQDQGQLGNYTLDDIREIFERVPEHLIADIVSGKEPLEVAPYGRTPRRRPDALGSPRDRIEQLRRLSERQGSAADEPVPEAEPRQPSSWSAERLVLNAPATGELLLRGPHPMQSHYHVPAASGPPPEEEVPPLQAPPIGSDDSLFFDLDAARRGSTCGGWAAEIDDVTPRAAGRAASSPARAAPPPRPAARPARLGSPAGAPGSDRGELDPRRGDARHRAHRARPR